jgi:hypothetical protein
MKYLLHSKKLKILHGFLGLLGYYKKFMQRYGRIVAPLKTFLIKNDFIWNDETKKVFQALKEAICTNPILVMLDFTNTFILGCDALGNVIGVVSMQHGFLLAFPSKKVYDINLG